MKPKIATQPPVSVVELGTINGKPIRLTIGTKGSYPTKQLSVGDFHATSFKELLSAHIAHGHTVLFHEELPVVKAMLDESFGLHEFPNVRVKCPKRFMRILQHEVLTRLPATRSNTAKEIQAALQKTIEETETFLRSNGG